MNRKNSSKSSQELLRENSHNITFSPSIQKREKPFEKEKFIKEAREVRKTFENEDLTQSGNCL